MSKNITNYNNCPNCGAPIEHKYNHQCPYCKTMLDMRVRETKEINPRYMRNVKLIEIENDPVNFGMLRFLFRGDYQYFPQVLEYKKGSDAMVINFEDIKPFEVSFCIAMDIQDVYKKGTKRFFEILYRYFPKGLDIYSVIEAIRNSRYKYILGEY